MTVAKIASKIYQAAKAACNGIWAWRLEWSKAMKQAWRQIMKKSEISKKEETSSIIKGVRMVAEYQAQELDKLAEIELAGSPKQINWAQSIITTFLAQASQEIENAVIRAEEGSMPNKWAYDVLDSALEIARSISGNAGEIINQRGRLTGSMISQLAQSRYNA